MEPTQLTARILAWLGIDPESPGPDTAAVSGVAAAVVSWVDTLPIAARHPEWTDAMTLGATMLGARLVRRRNSPAGIEAFTANGTAYTRREDPDAARLLELHAFARPQIG